MEQKDTRDSGIRKKKTSKRTPTAEGVRLRLADLCARSEQCEADIRTKISRAGLSREEAEEIVEFLKSHKFLDDARFARAYSRDKVRFAGWGRNKIRAALFAKHLASDDIEEGISAIEEKEYIAAMRKTGLAKASGLDLHSRADVAKFVRHMQSRGFESNLIFQLLEALRHS